MIMAAEIRGITPIVRPEKNDPAVINKYLDRGTMGVQVPHVNTATEARAVLEACLYHPLGTRRARRRQDGRLRLGFICFGICVLSQR